MGLTSQCLILATVLLFSVSCYILEATAMAPELDPTNKNVSINPNELARFAIRQHNLRERKHLEFREMVQVHFKRAKGNKGMYAYLAFKAKDGFAMHRYSATVLMGTRNMSLVSFIRQS